LAAGADLAADLAADAGFLCGLAGVFDLLCFAAGLAAFFAGRFAMEPLLTISVV
jgi:hypothetical protein